jgi:energy-coupling factor transporter ATP-binding protein EcfA2
MARPVTNPTTLMDQALTGFVIEKLKDHDTLQGILDAAGVSVGGPGGASEIVTIDPQGVELGKVENPHPLLKKVLTCVSAGLNVYLYGPAGSGKSTIARHVAEALNAEFQARGKIDYPEQLLGLRYGNGDYKRPAFQDIWERGGVFALDDTDRSDPSALTAFNDVLSSGYASFGDGTYTKKHESAFIIASGNGPMLGETEGYTAANQHDAAIRDRFAFIHVDYDEDFERTLVPGRFGYWVDRVHAIRRASKSVGVDSVMATPRAIIQGATLLHNGIKQTDAENMVIFKGVDSDTQQQINRLAATHEED